MPDPRQIDEGFTLRQNIAAFFIGFILVAATSGLCIGVQALFGDTGLIILLSAPLVFLGLWGVGAIAISVYNETWKKK